MGFFFSSLFYLALFSLSLPVVLLFRRKSSASNLPPGRRGWPIIGETLDLALACQRGDPARFVKDRMSKYSPHAFKTSLLEADMVVICGASGNKFLFSNDDKLVVSWWQRSMKKILCPPSLFHETLAKDNFRPPSFLPEFLRPDALQHYTAVMDSMAADHFSTDWSPPNYNNGEVKVFPLAKKYSFALAFRLFMSIEDSRYVEMISRPFEIMTEGFLSVPIDFPGTAFNRALKASKFVHSELLEIIRKRRMELGSPPSDLLSRMVSALDENGNVKSEMEVSTQVICLLFATHHTTTSVITFVLKYLDQFPDVYSKVLKEQMDIAKSKGPDGFLKWGDIQKMKYTWNVAKETMRLTPPVQGAFREAITDFTYAGFTIPKGWKMHWNVNTTHKDPKYFPDPERFDPSRFEGKGPEAFSFVAFGGGPRMCPGREYARAQILAFIHNVVTRFRWEKLDPTESIAYNPSPLPSNGFPIRLHPL